MCDIINQNDTVLTGDAYDNEWKIIHEKKLLVTLKKTQEHFFGCHFFFKYIYYRSRYRSLVSYRK